MKTLRGYQRPAVLGVLAGLVAAVLVAAASLLPVSSLAAAVPVGVVVAATVGISVVSRTRVLSSTARLDGRLERVIAREETLERQLAEVAAISTMSALDVPYPLPLGGRWALAWDGAVVLAREVGSCRPGAVVELGSGASSLVIGMQLRTAGRGHLYTLDHEPGYAAVTRRHVAAYGLQDWVTVLDAPLMDLPLGDEHFRWYRLPPEVESLGRIDFLVVDGPPQGVDREGTPRYPALPVLGARLGPDAAVFVDDASRDGEQRMLDRWATEDPGWVREIVPTVRGTAILRRSP